VPLAAPATALQNACQIKACRNERGCEAPREGPNAMEFAAAGGSKILIRRHKYWQVDVRQPNTGSTDECYANQAHNDMEPEH
jgi:hypothetical protein